MNTFHDNNPTSQSIKKIRQDLELQPDTVIVPTDKTNFFFPMSIQEYEKQVIAHLEDHGTTITNQDLTRAIQEAREFLEQLKPHLSKKEYQFLRETIESKAVPTPKLMIKDHQKKIPTTNQYPTRLVVPGQNFNAGFAKMGYLAIKRILERAGNDHTKCLIEQSYHLKRHLETLNLTATNSTLASIDATKYYTSIRYKLVKKAIEYFSRDLSPEDKATIEIGLSMIQKGMNSTYLSFKDKYYQYDGNHEDPDEKGLTIGGYESATLSDVVGSYIPADPRLVPRLDTIPWNLQR